VTNYLASNSKLAGGPEVSSNDFQARFGTLSAKASLNGVGLRDRLSAQMLTKLTALTEQTSLTSC
jgi:hypothetical protein